MHMREIWSHENDGLKESHDNDGLPDQYWQSWGLGDLSPFLPISQLI